MLAPQDKKQEDLVTVLPAQSEPCVFLEALSS